MPALTITAIDHTTAKLSIPAHGLNTGDGPGAVYTQGGTLPAGLAPVTDYYVIKIDTNTIKLADSNAHALAGTALSFTDNGSGVLQFLLGPPYRNPRVYTVGSQLFSADLMGIFAALIALWNFLTGQAQAIWNGLTLAGGLKVGGQPFSFPGFAFTADPSSEQLAAVANPLQTGDGPLRATSTGALPGGLVAGNDYYWIRVDADHGRLATARASAFTGASVDITSAGSGSLMLLPQAGTTRVSDAEVTRHLIVGGSGSVAGLLSPNGGIGPLIYKSITTPPLSSGKTNNYNPAGLSTAVVVRIQTIDSTFPTLSGLAGGSDGRQLTLYNVGTDTITVPALDSSSSAANQFLTPGRNLVSLGPDQGITVVYDGTISKWRFVAKNF